MEQEETGDVCGSESEDWEGNKRAMGKVQSSKSEGEGETLSPLSYFLHQRSENLPGPQKRAWYNAA